MSRKEWGDRGSKVSAVEGSSMRLLRFEGDRLPSIFWLCKRLKDAANCASPYPASGLGEALLGATPCTEVNRVGPALGHQTFWCIGNKTPRSSFLPVHFSNLPGVDWRGGISQVVPLNISVTCPISSSALNHHSHHSHFDWSSLSICFYTRVAWSTIFNSHEAIHLYVHAYNQARA